MLTCFARAGRSLRFALRPTLRPVLNAAFLSKKKLLQVDPAHPPKPMTVPAEKIQKSPEPHVDLQEASPKDVPPLVNQPTQPTTPVERPELQLPLQHEKESDTDTSSDSSDYEDPPLHENPSAWALNRTADTLKFASKMTTGTLGFGKSFAETGIGFATTAASSVLPRFEIPVPDLIKDTVRMASDTSKTAVGTVLDGVKLVGSTAGEFVGETVGSVLGSQELSSSSPTLKAGSRLARVGVKSYTTVLGAVGGVTKDITKAAKDGAVNVLTHVAGEDVGNIVKQTSEIGEEVLKFGLSVKTLGHADVAKEVAGKATKTILSTVTSSARNTALDEIQKKRIQNAKNKNETVNQDTTKE